MLRPTRVWIALSCAALVVLGGDKTYAQTQLDLNSIPLSEWWDAGETEEIEWRIRVSDATLRHDQRFEVLYSANVRGKALDSGRTRDLFVISRLRADGGDWVTEPLVVHKSNEVPRQNPSTGQPETLPDLLFEMRAFVRPGEYRLWLALYDRETGKHNVAMREIRVNAPRNDPLPRAFESQPQAELMETKTVAPVINDALAEVFLPVKNRVPAQIEIISPFNPPEQWADNGRMKQASSDQTIGALAALSQLDLAAGSIAITGLNLVERNIVFERNDFGREDWPELVEAFKKADTPTVTFAALEGRKKNAAFFREFMESRLSATADGTSRRVFIVVSSSVVFESGSDVKAMKLERDCRCTVYHIRLRILPLPFSNMTAGDDSFDDLGDVIQSRQTRRFHVMSGAELRQAIARIIQDLEQQPL